MAKKKAGNVEVTQKPTASVSTITSSGGQTLSFSSTDKIILVGPNNSGKSQALREIMGHVSTPKQSRPKTIAKLTLNKTGNAESLRTFLLERGTLARDHYQFMAWSIHTTQIVAFDTIGLQGQLINGFFKLIDANDRLKITAQQNSISPFDQRSKPQHVLYDDSALMDKVSFLFRQAFGRDLFFDYRGGSILPVHVGTKPNRKLIDRVGDAYVAEVRSNPLLHEQGDGVKSYAGILFEAVVGEFDVTLIDEPEAFLHPPQMRRLGATLASEVKGQLWIASHSSDILRGFLEGTRGKLRILRIRREGDFNFLSEASPEMVSELWSRPELRYSNALDGIFHEQTIICEDDSDCRLYNAVADSMEAESAKTWKDTAYVPTGGKQGAKKVAEVLRSIGVPIKAVFDIDFLSDRTLVSETISAFGGDWSNFSAMWHQLDAAVRSGVKPKTVSEIGHTIVELLDKYPDRIPRGEIIDEMKQGSAWSVIKKYGVSAFPSGQAQVVLKDIIAALEQIGIYLVPVGELENFCREFGNKHGPRFVNRLLTEMTLDDERLAGLRAFVERVHLGPHAPITSSDQMSQAQDLP